MIEYPFHQGSLAAHAMAGRSVGHGEQTLQSRPATYGKAALAPSGKLAGSEITIRYAVDTQRSPRRGACTSMPTGDCLTLIETSQHNLSPAPRESGSGHGVRSIGVPHSGQTPDTLPVRLYPHLRQSPFRRRRWRRTGPRMKARVG